MNMTYKPDLIEQTADTFVQWLDERIAAKISERLAQGDVEIGFNAKIIRVDEDIITTADSDGNSIRSVIGSTITVEDINGKHLTVINATGNIITKDKEGQYARIYTHNGTKYYLTYFI